jgi:hypothetical protein
LESEEKARYTKEEASRQLKPEKMMMRSPRGSRILRLSMKTLVISLCLAGWAFARPNEAAEPAVNANLGPCSVDFTVSQKTNRPLYNAQISVSIAYGFLGMKKMDLQIGTNNEGKARFVGLPSKVHNPPLTFVVRYKGWTKNVDYWPQVQCRARYSVIMGAR